MNDTLKRRQREQKPRETFYYDLERKMIYSCTHDFAVGVMPDQPLWHTLWNLPWSRGPVVVYLVCGTASDTAPAPDWYREPVAHGWTLRYRHDVPARRVATYTRGDIRIDLRHSPAWWDDCRDAALLARAHRALESKLREAFKAWVDGKWVFPILLGTPAQTGLDLLDRSLPFGQEYPVLPQDVRDILHRGMTQARRELYPREGQLPSFYYYDARFAYAACVRHLPCQFQGHEVFASGTADVFLGYTPAFYFVEGRVPDGWNHVGLVARKASSDPSAGWEWPRTPGQRVYGWLSNAEYAQARTAGWDLAIRERITFAPDKTPGCDPLKTWQEKLVTLWMDAKHPLHRAAVRNIVLHTIGAFHRRENREVVIVPESEYVFDPAFPPKHLPGLGYEITRPIPVSREMARYDHPEWSAYIWAKQRDRLTAEMLRRPFAALVGCNTDAYYTVCPAGAVDDGKIGRYRRKGAIHALRPAPQDYDALLALKEESERNNGE